MAMTFFIRDDVAGQALNASKFPAGGPSATYWLTVLRSNSILTLDAGPVNTFAGSAPAIVEVWKDICA
jgi:hypothetical protein